MIRTLTTKKEIILDAALRLVSKKNTLDITIREIASEANVNVAAINYYFKSKAQLFMEMDKLFMDNFVDAFKPLTDKELSDEDKLRTWLIKATSYASHYPGMLVYLKDKFMDENSNDRDIEMKMDLINYISEIRLLFIEVIKPPVDDGDRLFMAFMSSIVFPFIADSYLQGMGLDMVEIDQPDYINLIINKFKSEVVK